MLFIALFMLLSAGISFVSGMDSAFYPLLLASLLTALLGAFPLIFVERTQQITNKEGFCIVVGSWLVACLVGMFPYLIWGGEFSLVNAWFESVSGFTTTGSTILNDIEVLPREPLYCVFTMKKPISLRLPKSWRVQQQNFWLTSLARDSKKHCKKLFT